ncbi:MAG: alpha/beta hydrolase [Pseudomonadales bacterium]
MPILNLDDIDLYYEIVGDGEPLLFIHGLGSSCRDWEQQVSFFANRYKVIVFDVRGHGKSNKPPGPYSIPLFATDTVKMLKALGISSAHIVGISMGGMIAFQLAVSQPEVVRSLVIVNSSPEFIVQTLKLRMQVWQRFLIVRLLGMRKIGKVLSKRLFPKAEQEELRAVFVERWAENDAKAYREAMAAIIGWSVADRIDDIGCPTLMIAADGDYTPVVVKEAYVERMAKAKLVVIEDSKHALPLEKPKEFNVVLEGFLAEQG